LKILLPEMAALDEGMVRFEREARAASQLRSPHVARVFDVDALADGTPYIVMEFLEGRDLAAELMMRGPLPIADAVDYVMQACDAMAEAHRAGTVHRDIKPSNLFLATNFGQPTIKVLDFGISKVASEGLVPSVTTTRSTLGTALYMSPEQVRSAKHVDARTDVWSLGVVLYELLTASAPFGGETTTAVAAAIVADDPQHLRSLRPEVAPELESVVMRALEKNPALRFQNAGELATALGPFARSVVRSKPVESAPTLVSAGVEKPSSDPPLAPESIVIPSLDPPARPDSPFLRPVAPSRSASAATGRPKGRTLWVFGGFAALTLAALGAFVIIAIAHRAASTGPSSLSETTLVMPAITPDVVRLETQPSAAPTPQASPDPPTVAPAEASASSAPSSSLSRTTKRRPATKPPSAEKPAVPEAKSPPTSEPPTGAPKPAIKNAADLPDNPG
jgi:serine/threonine-protein kinase